MKMKQLALTAALILASIATAQAQGMYVGIGYTQVNGDTGNAGTVKPTMTTFNLGYAFDKTWSIEGRVGTSASSDSAKISGVSVDFKADNFAAMYAKGTLPLSEQFGVYGLIGYNSLKLSGSAGGFSASSTKDGGSYGVGAEFNVTKNVALSAEWARHFSDTTGTTFGVSYKF